jgi:hypothetical protein
MEINLIILFPNSAIVGLQHFKPEKGFEFNELNIFLLFVQLQFRW